MQLRLPTNSKPWFMASAIAGAGTLALLLRRLPPAIEYRLHAPEKDGLVLASPEGLAASAGVPLSVYALASCMQSEEKSDRGRLAVGRAVWNAVHQDLSKIFHKLAPSGRFGAQTANPYAATTKPPTARTLGLAQAIVDGRVEDFVEGAAQWDAPAAQDRLHALYLEDPAKYPKYRHSSAEVGARRRGEGLREVWVTGVPDTRFWTRGES